MKTVRIKVHAGSGWIGHVVFTMQHPENAEIYNQASHYQAVEKFCEEHGLKMDEEFHALVKRHLTLDPQKGMIIDDLSLTEKNAISSANDFLRKNFSNYTY